MLFDTLGDLSFDISLLEHYSLTLTLLLALVLDLMLGEAKKYHYLVGFGAVALKLEWRCNLQREAVESERFYALNAFGGACCWVVLVIPVALVYYYFLANFLWYWQVLLDAVVVYLALGLSSLQQHAQQVYRPLQTGDLTRARHFTGYLVSRDTANLSSESMARATVESVLENGHDSVIATLVYFIIGGAPLVIVHRLANTLDAMWGYRNPRYASFGFASAKLDDILGFVSAKCCTLLYALQGRFLLSVGNAYRQGKRYKSHNGGWVMAAGATVMKRVLGGRAMYDGAVIDSPVLGDGQSIGLEDIPSSIRLVRRATWILWWVIVVWQTLALFVFS